MKILVVLYYRSMAEYFMDLENALKTLIPGLQFRYCVLYPCAWIALRRAGRPAHFLWPAHSGPAPDTLTEGLQKALAYHETILGVAARPDLNRLLQGYLTRLETLRQLEDIRGAILVGDSRLSVVVADHVMRRHDLPVLYWEQGPFRTTQLNAVGVNSNAVFAPDDGNVPDPADVLNAPKLRRVFGRTVVSRLGTLLTDSMAAGRWPSGMVPIDRVNVPRGSATAGSRHVVTQMKEMPSDAFVYILQVPYDNQIIEHGGLGRDVTVALHTLLTRITPERLLIRQHPLHQSRYPQTFYELCTRCGVRFVDDLPLVQILDHAEGIIVANSTVGAEAMERGRKVLVLGDAFYSHPEVSFTLNGSVADADTLDRFLTAPSFLQSRCDHIRTLIARNFFRGHYLFEHEFDLRLLERVQQTFQSQD